MDKHMMYMHIGLTTAGGFIRRGFSYESLSRRAVVILQSTRCRAVAKNVGAVFVVL